MSSNEELVYRIQLGEDQDGELMLQLWQQNRGLICAIARRYAAYEEMEDLEQQGFIGLCDAVQRYRQDKGAAFSTYAVVWIRQSILRYLAECSAAVRIPAGRQQDINRYRRACADFEKAYSRRPSDSEICRLLGEDIENVQRIAKAAQIGKLASLDIPAREDGDATVGDLLADVADVEGGVLDALQQEQLADVLWPMVDALPQEQAAVIRMRYQEGLTLKQCGERLQLAPEGIRQHENSAMRELRKPKQARRLAPFLPEAAEAAAYRGSGLESFKRTWTSSTEKVALRLHGEGGKPPGV